MIKNPIHYFKSSPKIIRLAVMTYVRFPLSLRNVEELHHEGEVLECVVSKRRNELKALRTLTKLLKKIRFSKGNCHRSNRFQARTTLHDQGFLDRQEAGQLIAPAPFLTSAVGSAASNPAAR